LETSIGIAAGVALAAALPELPYACGLATVSMFTAEVVDEPLLPTNGFLPVKRLVPGTELPTADQATTAKWEQRLARVEALKGRVG
jgi:O-succinylbenzoate synthase